MAAKVDLMKSLEKSLVGTHCITWQGPGKTNKMDSDCLAFCAWDYLKNRSPMVKKFENFKLVSISSGTSNAEKFRTSGRDVTLVGRFDCNKQFHDSVALGRGFDSGKFFKYILVSRFKANTSPLRNTSPFTPSKKIVKFACRFFSFGYGLVQEVLVAPQFLRRVQL